MAAAVVAGARPRSSAGARTLWIGYWNGEKVRIAFIIDASDREVIAHVAVVGSGISSSDVRDMMLAAVERRSHQQTAPRTPSSICPTTARATAPRTRDFATALDLIPCFTPVRSPESNDMA